MKIAIICDSLLNRGGIERIALLMAKSLKADVITGKYDKNLSFEEYKNIKKIILLKKKYPQRIGSLILRKKLEKLKLNYDLCIIHGGASLSIARNNSPTIWYCHAPTIWLYDLYPEEVKKFNFFIRPFFMLFCRYLRLVDKANVKHISKIITNSKNVRNRVKRIYNREAEVVHPPVDIKKFRYIKTGDFYLSTARLDPDKRVNVVVKAFQKMPDKNLIVISSGSDSNRINKMAKGYDNIKVLGRVSDERLAELYGSCIATVFATMYEDFGMVAIESMSAGKPVIAVGDMGFAESVIHNKTGILYDGKIENLIKSIKEMGKEKAKRMRKDCEARSKEFSEEVFIHNLKKTIKKMM